MSKNYFYNSSYFKFFRRYLKKNEMEKGFIDLIYKRNKTSDLPYNKAMSSQNEYPKKKNINLDIIFQKGSLDLIHKIRDLFIVFDFDRSNSFDQYEFFQMFTKNQIPIKMEEIIYLFKFNAHKKSITFSELINLTFDPDFDRRYKEVIKKVKPRCQIGIICPNDFSGMLSHLCEFGILSSDKKKFRLTKSKPKKRSYFNITSRNKFNFKSKTKDEIVAEKDDIKIINNKYKSNSNNNIIKLGNSKKANNMKMSYRKGISKNLIESITDIELYEKTKKFNEEKKNMINNYKAILEITNKKLTRNEIILSRHNYRNKIELSKKNLAKSINTLNKINSNINSTEYISYSPLDEKFINIKTGNLFNFNLKNTKHKKIKAYTIEEIAQLKPILTEPNTARCKNAKYNPFLK